MEGRTEELSVDSKSQKVMIPEEEPIFSSTGATLQLPKDAPRDPRMHVALLFIVVAGLFGVINGLDFIDGDKGLVTDRGFIYSQTQTASFISQSSPGSAILTGTLTLHDGSPASNFTIEVVTKVTENGTQRITRPSNVTDADGRFRLEGLNPGLMTMFVVNNSHDSEGMTHRIILSPGALFEPYGFTHLDVDYASPEAFDIVEEENNGLMRWIDLSEEQRGRELYDPTAAAVYDIVGAIFFGIGLIAIVLGGNRLEGKECITIENCRWACFFQPRPFLFSLLLGHACDDFDIWSQHQ